MPQFVAAMAAGVYTAPFLSDGCPVIMAIDHAGNRIREVVVHSTAEAEQAVRELRELIRRAA